MRILCAVAAAATVLALGMAGPAFAVEGDGSPYDFAGGGGQTAQGDQFGFTAHNGPRDPSGYLTYQTGTFNIGGAVTCLNAGAGRLATIGIVIEQSSDPSLIGQGFLLFVEDRDAVESASADRVGYSFVDRPATRRCTARRPPSGAVVRGNIVVEDSADEDPPEDPPTAAA